MPYVIQRTPDGAFVTDSADTFTGSSYTRDLLKARTFDTREAAERERCPENEVIRHTDELLRR